MLEETIQQVFQTMCDGLECEALERTRLSNEAGTGDDFKFSLDEEREIGTAMMLAYYLRQANFFPRLDWYFYGNTELRPDLTVWLPEKKRLIYLELKRVGQGYSYYNLLKDMKKLEAVSKCNENNALNGLIVVQYARSSKPSERLRQELTKLNENYPEYRLYGPKSLELANMDGHPINAAIGLLFRRLFDLY